MRRFISIGVIIALVLVLFIPLANGEKNPNVAPSVSITSPEDGAVINEKTLDVVVMFGPKEEGQGNVRYLLLYLDGAEIARYENPANIKKGTYTFTLDIKGLESGDHTLQAYAYQAEIRAGLEGKSSIVTFTIIGPIVWQVKGLSMPVDVVVDKDRNVYVLELGASRVGIYDKDGKYQSSISLNTNAPKGIALDKDGNLYVADTGNNRITKMKRLDSSLFNFTLDESFGTGGVVGSQGTDNGQFNQPWGIGVDSEGNVYVTDSGNNRIQKFDNKGKFKKTWGTFGTEPGQLNQAKGIFVNILGWSYITDSSNNRIQEFGTVGAINNVFGTEGMEEGQFLKPSDVTRDAYYVYVLDTGNNRVQRFNNEECNFTSQLNSLGLNNALGIAVDSDPQREYFYVADTDNNRLIKVEMPFTSPTIIWNAMKEAIKNGNFESAIENFSEESKEQYREAFNILGDRLLTIINDMQEIELVYIRGDVAIYKIHRMENGTEFTYDIYFEKDENGNWKIMSF